MTSQAGYEVTDVDDVETMTSMRRIMTSQAGNDVTDVDDVE